MKPTADTAGASAAALSLAAGAPPVDVAGDAAPAEAAAPEPEPESGIDKTGRPWKRVHLDNPLERGGVKVTSVIVRKPMGGDLRGTQLVPVYNMDVAAMSVIVPRITEPTIHRQEFLAMDGEDIASVSSEVVNFLLTKSQRAEAGLQA